MAWGFQSNIIIKLRQKALKMVAICKFNPPHSHSIKKHSMIEIDDILKLKQLQFYYRY